MFEMNSAAYLGDANGKDGMRATARVIHGCGAYGSMGIAKRHKIIHVSVVVNQAFRQICTQRNACVFFSLIFFCRKTMSYSQHMGRPAGALSLSTLRPHLQVSFSEDRARAHYRSPNSWHKDKNVVFCQQSHDSMLIY